MVADYFVAVLARVLVIVAKRNAEWDEAAPQPATQHSNDTAKDPC